MHVGIAGAYRGGGYATGSGKGEQVTKGSGVGGHRDGGDMKDAAQRRGHYTRKEMVLMARGCALDHPHAKQTAGLITTLPSDWPTHRPIRAVTAPAAAVSGTLQWANLLAVWLPGPGQGQRYARGLDN